MSNPITQPPRHISSVDYVQNIGRFESVRGSQDTAFQPLSLIFSENGRGKTTLCAILRSLATGDPTPILERKRLSSTTAAKAVVSIAGSRIPFDGSDWSMSGPRIAIYDEHFVDTNVHSGLNVDAGHRKGVHELVVGEQGVRLQRKVENLNRKISSLQSEWRQAEHKVREAALGSYSVDEFCALRPLENLDLKIEVAKQRLSVLRNAETIRATGEFRPFALPPFDENDLTDLLGKTLSDVESTALEAIAKHVSGLGVGGEDWISRGWHYLGDARECPFCGKGISASALIDHYRAYFSESYAVHKRRIQGIRNGVSSNLSGDRLATLQRILQQECDKREFWARYFELPAFGLDLDHLAITWNNLRQDLLAALDKKVAAPVDPVSLSARVRDAMAHYRDLAETVCTLSTSLVEQNPSVQQVKAQLTEGSVWKAQMKLDHLRTIRNRFHPDIDAACKDYLAAKEMETQAKQKKASVRATLHRHRHRVFGTYETAINRLLNTFNADFTLEALRPSDARGVPSSAYGVRVNNDSMTLDPVSTTDPLFRTTLSAGDRNTLALAFFFASLQQRALHDTIIVIDDPISSLDDARAFATAQEIRRLEGQCRQLIILSHSRNLLCQLWERANKNTTATLQICDAGSDCSTLAPWDIEAAAVTEFDRLFQLVGGYGEASRGNSEQVAPALRILLESFLRVAFVTHFPPGRQLGQFIQRAKQRLEEGQPILSDDGIQELAELNEYARLFHHSTHQAGRIEAVTNVNSQELRGYARRVIRFITLDGRIDEVPASTRPSLPSRASSDLAP